MRKIINQPEAIVTEMGRGIALTYPGLVFDPKFHYIMKRETNPNKVTLISGGGSGHEPAHAGYIGKGMLDVAVCGDVFASPSQVQIYRAIKASRSSRGTLLIIKNYSGDMMNFLGAAAMAKEDGIDVEYVKVDDDVAVQDSLYTVGRRGVAGTVLVHKVAGAQAERGGSLLEVKAAAGEAIRNIRTMGFALSSCTVPAKGTPTFEIDDGEMELGVGIHGEPGIRRERELCSDELAERLVDSLLAEYDLSDGSAVTLMVNGLGSTPLMELYVFNASVRRILDERGVEVYRSFTGNYMTSIDMLGASVTLMKMTDHLRGLIDEPSSAPAFVVEGPSCSRSYDEVAGKPGSSTTRLAEKVNDPSSPTIEGKGLSLGNILFMVKRMGDCIIENEVPFCELDSHAGDGDFGMSLAKGFRQLRCEWDGILVDDSSNIGKFLDACSMVIMEHCGGASGPIWGSAFRAAARSAGDASHLALGEFADLMQAAVKGVQAIGERSFGRGAVAGDKTLIDALAPCANELKLAASEGAEIREALVRGAEAAVAGAKSTESIVARMGRAGTVGKRSIGYPDAGAHALGVVFTDIAASME